MVAPFQGWCLVWRLCLCLCVCHQGATIHTRLAGFRNAAVAGWRSDLSPPQKKHWAEAHKSQCKEISKNVPEWFPNPEHLLRVVKRTGMTRVGALGLLDSYRDGKGTFPGNGADEMESYAMTAWVMDLGRKIKALDNVLEVKGRIETPAPTRPSMLAGWFGRRAAQEGESSLESLHQDWVKGGKAKGASHESFFDTEFLLEELKLQREVLTKFKELWGDGEGEALDDAREKEIGEFLEELEGEVLPRHVARKVILVMGPVGNDRARKTAKIVQSICSWSPHAPGSSGDIPEELAIAAAEEEGVELRQWQVCTLASSYPETAKNHCVMNRTQALEISGRCAHLPPDSGPLGPFNSKH